LVQCQYSNRERNILLVLFKREKSQNSEGPHAKHKPDANLRGTKGVPEVFERARTLSMQPLEVFLCTPMNSLQFVVIGSDSLSAQWLWDSVSEP